MKTCSRCVMDDCSDQYITFDENGICNYCTKAINDRELTYYPNEEGEERLNKLIEEIKNQGKNQKYDCIMGLSGGLDSSYLAYLGSKWGLRIVGVHIDDGFDTEISKNNIDKLTKAANIHLEIIKPDEEEFLDLTKSYMKAGVPNLAVPQDNVLFAFIYDYMRKNHIKYFLSGSNFALESILQKGNTYSPFDTTNIRTIHKLFGNKPIKKLKFISYYKMAYDRKIMGIKTVLPLNLVDYNRDRAFVELKEFCGFEYYGSKHLENILTAFIQLYWFPQKFGVDKRKSHYSSMIVSGQMTREEAVKLLQQPPCDPSLLINYVEIVKRKLGLSNYEFDEIMKNEPRQHSFYKTDRLLKIIRLIRKK